jgi:hypothetical protein
MKDETAIKVFFAVWRLLCLSVAGLPITFSLSAQETNSNVSGLVRSASNELLQNATVTVIHEPTKNTYTTTTNANGYFYFFNIKPGGPYSITISFSGLEPLLQKDLFLGYAATNFYSSLHGNELSEFILNEKNDHLDTVILRRDRGAKVKYGMETGIDNEMIRSLPSISRNFQDYLRLVPNARISGDGISLAGQNNKYNAFFIDGSNTNDILGLANSGTAGGQTGSPPISMEAIEEIKVLQSPYDVQYSNFTGGSVNAITKSGSNQFKSSAWYFFRNEAMAGRSPTWVPVPGLPGQYARPRLTSFFNQTAGVSASGAFVKNKLFYFVLLEYQAESQPQPYDFAEYRGNSDQQQLIALTETLQKHFGYDAGSFLQSSNDLNARRFTAKIDWNLDTKNKITFSYRFNDAERTTSQMQNGSTVIRFSNNRYRLPSTINSGSIEWKRYLKNSGNNRLLLTYNNELTQRRIIGQPFPAVAINDGVGVNITFGSNGASNTSRFTASEFSMLDVVKFVKNKHAFCTGIDFNFADIKDLALGSYFGSYRFASLDDFIRDAYPTRYTRNLSLDDDPGNANAATAKYNPVRAGIFLNDEIHLNRNLTLMAGLRLDANALPLTYKEDSFFNSVARPEVEKYYDLEGAVSGRAMKTDWRLSPRFGLSYRIPQKDLTIQGGAGIFSGHILNVWASQLYSVNIATLNLAGPNSPPQYYGLHFNPDPYNQPNFQSLGINPDSAKGSLQLAARNYKYPTVFRTSMSVEKSFAHNWTISTEVIFTKNVYENRYTNVNLLPPSQSSAPPGSRTVYSPGLKPDKIPLPGGNPYSYIFLLGNNHAKTGSSYFLNTVVSKSVAVNFLLSLAYSFGRSNSLFEPIGNANTTDGQWTQQETVNGKNLASASVSYFELQHRVSAALTKKFSYGRCATMITFFYNGQSGSPFSYVYDSSIINDDGRFPSSNSDLIYIPTKNDLEQMIFVPNGYSPQQQKEFLNDYIEHDRYLRKHRGQFSEKNGPRLPFTNLIDLRLQQDFRLTIGSKETTVSIVYDVFNFTNMLNKDWGRTYFLSSNDNYALITFAGYSNSNTLTPQYKFKPNGAQPWSIQNSTAPGVSARWISQLGVKISF